MIKISKICDKNKNEFYDDVKESYLKLLNKIKKNEKKIYNIENRNKIIDYFYEDDKICENKVIEVITGDHKALEKVIKEIGVLEKNKDDKKLHDEFESIYNNFTNREFGRTWGKKIGVEICPYCNRSFIYTTPKKGTRPQYDHYYPKSKILFHVVLCAITLKMRKILLIIRVYYIPSKRNMDMIFFLKLKQMSSYVI